MRRPSPVGIVAIALACCFTVVVFLPDILQRFDVMFPFRGIEILGPDAEIHYAARVREVADGFPGLGNVFYSAPKDVPSIQPPLPEIVVAWVGALLSVDPVTAFALSKVILSFVIVLLFVAFVRGVTDDPWIAIVAVSAMLFGGALLTNPWDVPMFVFPAGRAFDFLRFARGINPQWSVGWFLLFLLVLVRWIKRPHPLPVIAMALCAVVMVYSYVYAWSFALATAGLLTLWYLVKDRTRLWHLALFWIIVIILSVPYFVHLATLMRHPLYLESAQRLGMVPSRAPLIGAWTVAFLLVAFASRRLWPRTWPLLPCMALAGLIAINQHVVTGQFMVPHHYHWYFIQPFGSLMACAFIFALAVRFVRISRGLWITSAAAIVVLSMAIAAVQQWGAYQGVRGFWGGMQELASVMYFLRDHAVPGQTVYSSDVRVLDITPVLTSADVYTATNANTYLVPLSRARDVYFFHLWLQGVTPAEAGVTFPTTRRNELSHWLYAIYYRELLGTYDRIPDDVVQDNVRRYAAYYALSAAEKINRYPIDVVVTTLGDPPTAALRELLQGGKRVFSDGRLDVVAVPRRS